MYNDYYDGAREELEIEFNSRYDYVQEANYGMSETPESLAGEEQYYFEIDAIASQDAMEARGGPVFVIYSADPRFDEVPF